MTSILYSLNIDGGDIALEEVDDIATAAAHADDYAFAQLLNLQPLQYGEPFTKAIIPMRGQEVNLPFVAQGYPANPILINPFRAVCGTRILANGTIPTPTDPVVSTAPEQNYRDIRSSVFAVARTNEPFLVGYDMPASLFPSGDPTNPRWDLIYAAMYVDTPSAPASIIVKPPTGGAAGPVTASPTYTTSMGNPPMATTGASPAIGVVTGTPGASPAFPAIPADVPPNGTTSQATIYFPLAYVLIPAGWTSGTTLVTPHNIQIVAPIGQIDEALGVANSGPVAVSSTPHTSPARPNVWMPPTMTGGLRKHYLLQTTASPGNLATLDLSLDWRNRLFRVSAMTNSQGLSFVTSPSPGVYGLYFPNVQPQQNVINAAQPFIVLPPTSGYDIILSSANAWISQPFAQPYYMPLTNLRDGDILNGIVIFYSGQQDGAVVLTLVRTNIFSGVISTLGSLNVPVDATVETYKELAVTATSTVIDTTTYNYCLVITPGNTYNVTWSAMTAQIATTPETIVQQGQSFLDDSAAVTGGLVGTGAGFLFYASSALYPRQFSYSSAVGLYVDLASGNLRLFQTGTNGQDWEFFIEATGAYDNL